MVTQKIAIYGLGAVTATIVRALKLNKVSPTILARNQTRADDLILKGFSFQYKGEKVGTFSFSQSEVEDIAKSKGNFDYIIMGMKNDHLAECIPSAMNLLSGNGKLVLIQNGFPEESVSALAPANKMIGGVVGWNTQLKPDGSYFQSNPGALIISGVDGSVPEIHWKTMLEPYIPIILTANLPGYRWHKIGINAIINGLSATGMLTLGELLFQKNGRRAAIEIVSEVGSIMGKLGISEGVVPGSVSLKKLAHGKSALPMFLRHLILLVIGLKYKKIKTSMVQDLENGRKTEIRELNGAIVEKGKTVGVHAKFNEAVVKKVIELESNPNAIDSTFLDKLMESK